MKTFLRKLGSRKLLVSLGAIALGIFYPPAVPLLKIVAPAYVGAEGIADAAGALYNAIHKV